MRRGAWYVALVLSVAHVAALAAPQLSLAAYLQGGRDSLARGQDEAALASADRALKLDPASREAIELKLRALVALDDRGSALKAYEAWVDTARREDLALLRVLARAELEHLVNDPLPVVQASALEALARAGDEHARQILEAAFHASTPSTLTWNATEALARLGHDGARARILQVASSGSGGTRIRAIQALRTGDGTAATGVLRTALLDPDVMVRVAAAEVASALNLTELVPALRLGLPSLDSHTQLWYAVALARLGDHGGDAILSAALAAPPADRQLLAARAFVGSADTAWRQSIRPLLDSPEPLNRLAAAELFLSIEPRSSIDVIKKAMEDPSQVVRREASRILAETEQKPDLWLFRWMLRDGAPLVRLNAARTLLVRPGDYR